MASVTFPVEFGGDGNTYTGDDNPNTGLANDGHRLRFVPALANAVAMAEWTKEKAGETNNDRHLATTAAAQAQGSRAAAQASELAATAAAAAAIESAKLGAAYYPSAAVALDDTEPGAYFNVLEGDYIQLYLNDNGAAKPLIRMASQESLDKLNARPDPLLTSLVFS
ncbi:hypothetical protein [Halomonas halocynthiae]|uniref:hypothetical protein n=1 Tax=Halomonas halocynthiae TaxID=176290 RepID=UPI000425D6E1|nr:hypothetical protein [Halomonas halocynthiae]